MAGESGILRLIGELEERERVFSRHLPWLRGCRRILDVATGSGYLARRFPRGVVCLDWDPSILQGTRRSLGGRPFSYVCADARRLPFPSRSFEGAAAWSLLAHIPDWRMAVEELFRVAERRVLLIEPKGAFAVRAFRDFRCLHDPPDPEVLSPFASRLGTCRLVEEEFFSVLLGEKTTPCRGG
jgi:ubiquinone/menaquinone biosynthesis C-methylase UbiE